MSEITKAQLISRAEKIRDEIKQSFIDIDHWNTSVRKPDEAPIDPDPDGKLKAALESTETFLAQQRDQPSHYVTLHRFRWWYRGKEPAQNLTVKLTGAVWAEDERQASKIVEESMRAKHPTILWMQGNSIETLDHKFGPTLQKQKATRVVKRHA